MSSYSYKLFIFSLVFPTFILPFVLSSPLPSTPYDKFINFLTEKKCTMPKEVKIPFPELSEPPLFNYLSTPLSECRTNDALEEYSEANMLCTEIFDVLKNITCVKYNKSLPVIESDRLSEDVCHDFESLRNILPLNENYLSGRLSDKLICKVMCSVEKYELLCKTLLWSYDTLSKIKNALSTEEEKEQMHGNDNIKKVPPNEVTSSEKANSVSEIIHPASQIEPIKELDKSKTDINLDSNKESSVGSNLNQTDQESHNSKATDVAGETISQNVLNKDTLDSQIQSEDVNKTADSKKYTTNNVQQSKSESGNKELPSAISDNVVKPIESENLSKLNPLAEHTNDIENKSDDNENEIDVAGKLRKKDKEMITTDPQANLDKTNLTPNVSGIKDNQNIKNATVGNLLNKENEDVGSKQVKDDNNADVKTSEKSVKPVAPATENDNELKNGFPEDDKKSKAKQTDIENKIEEEIEKPKQSDYQGPNDILPENDSKLSESFTQSVIPDEEVEHPEDKEQEFDDIENESDYAKPEYDNSLNIPPKNKETEIKSSVIASSNQLTNGYSSNISPKESIGQISEEIAMIAPFPEQEDSHFFFYFLSIVLIIMAGYLIFHNKQKIIALIVEGRHERRRRSGVGYKKLETK